MRTCFTLAVAAVLTVACPALTLAADVKPKAAAAPAEPKSLKDKIDPLAAALIDSDVVVGMVVGVIKNGEAHVFSYGETAKGSGVKPTGDTVFEIGSISKVFTGLLLSEMVERRELPLRERAQEYLPNEVKLPRHLDKPILVEHLSTHCSGLPRMPTNFKPADPQNPYADYTKEQLYAFLNEVTLNSAPGVSYEYSNVGVALLGHVLSRAAKKPYEALVRERILDPVGMNDTTFTLTDEQASRLASPYNAELSPSRTWDLGLFNPAGGLKSTPNDMLRFLAANLAKHDTPLGRAMERTHKIHLGTNLGISMGLGWLIARDGISRVHNGQTGGYHGYVGIVPLRKVGVVVLANTATERVAQFGEQVTRVAFGLDEKPLKFRKAIAVKPELLDRYTGVYLLVPGFALHVTRDDDKLMVRVTDQEKARIFPESETEFFYKVVDAQIRFKDIKDGKAQQLVLHQFGRDMTAQRVKD